MNKEVILTGIRSNGTLHLGTYLGAIKPIVDMQKTHSGVYQINMFVPDLHSFTTPVDHSALYKQTIDNLRTYVAAGLKIDDTNTFIYRQSYVSAHSELSWILSCFTYFGELRRMTQFKEKSSIDDNSQENSSNDPSVSAGLFMYPVLMAADILLYDAKWVPVGEDQRQHLELARDVAIRMNNKFGDIFTVPSNWNQQLEFINREKGARIRSLKNPAKKMSKSIEDPAGTINLDDRPEDAAKKVMSATTDSLGLINYDWEDQPGISNLLQIESLLDDKKLEEVIGKWKGSSNYGDLKKSVAEKVSNFLTSFQSNLNNVTDNTIIKKLEDDEIVINDVAKAKLFKVQKAIGIRP